MDDVRAVLDALGSERAALWAGQEGTRLAALFAATYPERTDSLVMYDPSARGLWAPDYPWAPTEDAWAVELRELAARWGDRDYLAGRGRRYVPTKAHDERFIDWYVWYTRRSASPAVAVAFHRMMMDGDVRDVLPAVRCPTLVCIAPGRATRRATSRPDRGGELVEVPGLVDGFSWANSDANAFMLDETRRFVGGVGRGRRSSIGCSRRCCSPTSSARRRRASELGDGVETAARAATTQLVRRELERYRGR